jgi:hypothetical protein
MPVYTTSLSMDLIVVAINLSVVILYLSQLLFFMQLSLLQKASVGVECNSSVKSLFVCVVSVSPLTLATVLLNVVGRSTLAGFSYCVAQCG